MIISAAIKTAGPQLTRAPSQSMMLFSFRIARSPLEL
jgi:hypothetical protein